MEDRKLKPPIFGVTDNAEFLNTPNEAAPLGSAINVRPVEVAEKRRRIGRRPAIVATFPTTLPGAPVAMGTIAKATGITGYSPTSRLTLVNPKYTPTTAYRLQGVVLDTDGSVLMRLNDTRATPAISAPPVNAGGPGGFYCCWNQDDPDIGYFGTLTKDTSHTTQNVWICGLNRFSVSARAITHQGYVVDADAGYTPPLGGSPTQGDTFPNAIHQFGPYLFVCVGVWIYTFRADNLTYLYRTACPWAVEVQSIKAFEYGGRHWLMAAFGGSVAIAGPVVADTSADPKEAFGEHFRAGLALFEITYDAHTPPALAPTTPVPVAVGVNPLISRSMPRGTTTGNPAYELHQTYRFSEWMTPPVGRIPYDFVIDSEGRAYVAHANQGFGYDPLTNADQRPNGPSNTSAVNDYACISCHVLTRAFESDAPATAWTTSTLFYIDPVTALRYGNSSNVGGWYADVPNGSYRREFLWGAGTYRCDIPPIISGARDPANELYAPTAYAIALDEDADRLYIAGRRPAINSGRANVWCLRASDGLPIWEARLAGMIQQGAISVDPTSGNVIVCGNRNASWYLNSSASAPVGTNAEMWELSASDGAVLNTFDLTDAVVANGYLTNAYANVGAYDVEVNANGLKLVVLAPYRYDT